jgi:hypothetical protein
MPGPFGGARYSAGRVGDAGWTLEWDGASVMIKAAAASKIGIQKCLELGVELARSGHPDYPPPSEPYTTYARRTEQTIEATQVLEPAEIKGWVDNRPYVTGRWGIRDGPAFQDPDEWREPQEVTIVDRAMFLEFGTHRMAPRPFLSTPLGIKARYFCPNSLQQLTKRWVGVRGSRCLSRPQRHLSCMGCRGITRNFRMRTGFDASTRAVDPFSILQRRSVAVLRPLKMHSGAIALSVDQRFLRQYLLIHASSV